MQLRSNIISVYLWECTIVCKRILPLILVLSTTYQVVPGVKGDKISCMQSSVDDSLEVCLLRNHTQIPKWAFPDSTEL